MATALMVAACDAGAQTSLLVEQDVNLDGGRAAFGPAQTVFDWSWGSRGA